MLVVGVVGSPNVRVVVAPGTGTPPVQFPATFQLPPAGFFQVYWATAGRAIIGAMQRSSSATQTRTSAVGASAPPIEGTSPLVDSFAANAPISTPGQRLRPQRSSAPSAIPAAGQTATSPERTGSAHASRTARA